MQLLVIKYIEMNIHVSVFSFQNKSFKISMKFDNATIASSHRLCLCKVFQESNPQHLCASLRNPHIRNIIDNKVTQG